MKKIDKDKVSFVDFLRSIKFDHREETKHVAECPTHFASFYPQARPRSKSSTEDNQLVRSAN